MIKPYTSQQPVDDFGLLFADLKYSLILPQNTNVALTIPGIAQRYKALIKTSGEVWVSLNQTSVLPAEPVGDNFVLRASPSELVCGCCGLCREVRQNDVLYFVSSGTNVTISVVLYSLTQPN